MDPTARTTKALQGRAAVHTRSAEGTPGFHITSGRTASGTSTRPSTTDLQDTSLRATTGMTVAREDMIEAKITNAVVRITKGIRTRTSVAGKTTHLLQVWTKAATRTWIAAGINVHRIMHQTTMVTILTCLHKNVLENDVIVRTVASHTSSPTNTALAVTDPREYFKGSVVVEIRC